MQPHQAGCLARCNRPGSATLPLDYVGVARTHMALNPAAPDVIARGIQPDSLTDAGTEPLAVGGVNILDRGPQRMSLLIRQRFRQFVAVFTHRSNYPKSDPVRSISQKPAIRVQPMLNRLPSAAGSVGRGELRADSQR